MLPPPVPSTVPHQTRVSPPPPTVVSASSIQPPRLSTRPKLASSQQHYPTTTLSSSTATSNSLNNNANGSKQTTTMILADSTPYKIKINQIKDNINLSQESVIIKRYPGHTAEEIAFYAPKPLSDQNPEQVIIIAGTNSLTRSIHQTGTVDEFEVVDEILAIARAARANGVKKIHVSSVLVRRGFAYRDVVDKVNDVLYMACLAENFIFMNQSAISLDHIDSDGIHPNFYGSTILKFNILGAFRTFDRNRMTFWSDYEKAMY